MSLVILLVVCFGIFSLTPTVLDKLDIVSLSGMDASSKEKNPWKVLGVQKGSGIDEIKSAWRKKSMELHPDKNPNCDDCQERMSEVNDAYQVLKKNAVINSLYISDLMDEQYLEKLCEQWGNIFEKLDEGLKSGAIAKYFGMDEENPFGEDANAEDIWAQAKKADKKNANKKKAKNANKTNGKTNKKKAKKANKHEEF